MKILLIPLCLALASLAGCNESRSERCKEVCQQESDCATGGDEGDEGYPYDQEECVAACVNLERDTEGRVLVDKHIECARNAGKSCEKLQECR